MKKPKKDIIINVELDENKIPENIKWSAEDGGVTNQDVNPVTQEIEEIKSVDYGKMVGVLINAINELKAEIDELKSRRTSIGVLGIIFGFLGVHKFMLGYKREGFILLAVSIIGGIITCGIAIIVTDIIGIIEGVMILNKTPMQFKKTYIDRKTFWFQ